MPRRQFFKVVAIITSAAVLGEIGVDALLSSEGELRDVDLSNCVTKKELKLLLTCEASERWVCA